MDDTATNPDTTDTDSEQPQRWRDVLRVHPAADLFPLIGKDELCELADDIAKNGLQVPIILWAETPKDAEDRKLYLLDGRSRLDAMEMAGIEIIKRGKLDLGECIHSIRDILSGDDPDPYAVAVSANIHRRHLTAEQKCDLIAKVLKAKPETSNNQIAKQVMVDDKTVAKVRTELESTSEIPKFERTIGADGRMRPAHKATRTSTPPETFPLTPSWRGPPPVVKPTGEAITFDTNALRLAWAEVETASDKASMRVALENLIEQAATALSAMGALQ